MVACVGLQPECGDDSEHEQLDRSFRQPAVELWQLEPERKEPRCGMGKPQCTWSTGPWPVDLSDEWLVDQAVRSDPERLALLIADQRYGGAAMRGSELLQGGEFRYCGYGRDRVPAVLRT